MTWIMMGCSFVIPYFSSNFTPILFEPHAGKGNSPAGLTAMLYWHLHQFNTIKEESNHETHNGNRPASHPCATCIQCNLPPARKGIRVSWYLTQAHGYYFAAVQSRRRIPETPMVCLYVFGRSIHACTGDDPAGISARRALVPCDWYDYRCFSRCCSVSWVDPLAFSCHHVGGYVHPAKSDPGHSRCCWSCFSGISSLRRGCNWWTPQLHLHQSMDGSAVHGHHRDSPGESVIWLDRGILPAIGVFIFGFADGCHRYSFGLKTNEVLGCGLMRLETHECAQRLTYAPAQFAGVPAGGRAWTKRIIRKNAQVQRMLFFARRAHLHCNERSAAQVSQPASWPRSSPKGGVGCMSPIPRCEAVLGAFTECKTHWILKDAAANIWDPYPRKRL